MKQPVLFDRQRTASILIHKHHDVNQHIMTADTLRPTGHDAEDQQTYYSAAVR